ncbi:MAG: sigma-54 interaction domain-containing protein, partial [Verrucomicrobiia bacterium]
HLPPVLIVGETGTGKTATARWLHHHGPRAANPMVEVNCPALPDTLAESELFGHERGAFTDARTTRIGLFEAANGGTLFLDELSSLSPGIQAKVLTAIEDHVIRRVGGNQSIAVDVRVIAATNQDLKKLVEAGRFREDLYHRLDLFRIQLPPLRERPEDLPALAEALLTRLCKRHRVAPKKISTAGLQRLLSYAWPGNVRELAHELERAIVFSDSATIDFEHLTGMHHQPAQTATNTSTPHDWFNQGYVFPQQGFSLEDAIDRIVLHALKQTNGNVSAAARLLGVSRDVVRHRIETRRLPV